ncbi:MAG: hypothetical protein QM729_20755 [Solirubrobacterales bacterium]
MTPSRRGAPCRRRAVGRAGRRADAPCAARKPRRRLVGALAGFVAAVEALMGGVIWPE